ncbi:hypothetical protein L228DRAFT_244631 [Xylona heveae TC161]|uniref:DUF974 domain-containing protein n=1 Tax=Xylona heveae (strain CBS 132557 / TC161) TaxID=1328760 RepID=A0A161THL1_XYLHT|nr:hypothetical protein L228DRAFT_244631 [Xylona heveae TC161]KZF25737.1 hypothetical protein L228DRAFT_244631 [Xylona heveae TC161]
MAHQRRQSVLDGHKQAHSLSLKVLRLSKPSLSQQYPLPPVTSTDVPQISPEAALSCPSEEVDGQFILSPLLTLPPAFGSAYVGETFSCTLCINNESLESASGPLISGVRIAAEMQTPSQTVPLDLVAGEEASKGPSLEPGNSLQRIVRFDLKEEGTHVLAVTVTYTETRLSAKSEGLGEHPAAGGRVRTFRKLYQFLAQQQIAVRTKSAELPFVAADSGNAKTFQPTRLPRFILEAQLENTGENPVTLEDVALNPKPPFISTSLNWDLPDPGQQQISGVNDLPILNPRDVMQVAFLLERGPESTIDQGTWSKEELENPQSQLSIRWRSSMGDGGFLTTGWLLSRKR